MPLRYNRRSISLPFYLLGWDPLSIPLTLVSIRTPLTFLCKPLPPSKGISIFWSICVPNFLRVRQMHPEEPSWLRIWWLAFLYESSPPSLRQGRRADRINTRRRQQQEHPPQSTTSQPTALTGSAIEPRRYCVMMMMMMMMTTPTTTKWTITPCGKA